MTKTFRLTTLAAMLAAASFGSHAAETADLAVKGTIRPSACNVSLSGNGVVDYGTISAVTLAEDAATALDPVVVSMTITCDAATRVALSTADNRTGTANSAAGRALINYGPSWSGLGIADGQGLGAYTIRLGPSSGMQATGDGEVVRSIYSHNLTSWTASGYGDSIHGIRSFSWAAPDTTEPAAYTTIVQQISVQAAIAPKSQLPSLTGGVQLDGNVTFTLLYL